MGIERTIRFPSDTPLSWPRVIAKLVEVGETPVLRMIDGLPAFPDEVPADDWRELRVGLNGGMVTIRRTSPVTLNCITWGTADPALARSWDRCCWAVSSAGGGVVEEKEVSRTPEEFRVDVSLT